MLGMPGFPRQPHVTRNPTCDQRTSLIILATR
jgi:hypothetical protein